MYKMLRNLFLCSALVALLYGCRKDDIPDSHNLDNIPTSLTESIAGNYVGKCYKKFMYEDCVESGGEDCFNCTYWTEYDTTDVEFMITAINDLTIHLENINSTLSTWDFEIDGDHFHENETGNSGYYNYFSFKFEASDSSITISDNDFEFFCEGWDTYRTYKLQKQ